MDSLPFGIEGYRLVRAGKDDEDFILDCMRENILCSVPKDEKDLRDLWIDDIMAIVSKNMGGGSMGNEVFKLVSGNENAGMLWMGISKDQFTCEEIGYLLGIFVRKDLRGKGLGKELVRSAEVWCTENGLLTMALNVGTVNGPAVCLYESMGYKGQSVVMRRFLK